MFGWFRKKDTPSDSDFAGITITMHVAGEQALFIMLFRDGTINRAGTGSVENAERDLFIGRTDPTLFAQLQGRIRPEILQWCGQKRSHPQPEGKICELSVGFKRADGQELMTEWRYGSESQGPPPEICQFVLSAIQATEPWFEQQKLMRERNRG